MAEDDDDNVLNFPPPLNEYDQRYFARKDKRKQEHELIISHMEAVSTVGDDELYLLWLEISERLFVAHDCKPNDLIEDIEVIRDEYDDDNVIMDGDGDGDGDDVA